VPPEQSILCGVGHASVIQLVANQYVSECRTRVLRAISRSLPLAQNRTSGSKWTIFSGRMGVTRGLTLPTTSEHNMVLRLLIVKKFLNDRPTRQKRVLILRADAERIANTPF
jgi:hypothetical protein